MLDVRTLFEGHGLAVADVACRHGRGRGGDDEQAPAHALVFVRRGCFLRSVDGVETLMDPSVAYCMNPTEEQRYDHPHDHGDDCTTLFVGPDLLAGMWGGELELPSRPLRTSAEIDLEHRLLLAAARRGERDEVFERGVLLVARTLEQSHQERVDAGRPATLRARRALVDGVRELLAESPGRTLPELACELAVSPHHLSRVFRSITGSTISRHRMRLRARAALESLAGGERDLARLAVDVGFADQSHLARVIAAETGRRPAVLRELLAV